MAIDQNFAGHDQRLGFLAGFGHAMLDHPPVQAVFRSIPSGFPVNYQIGDIVQPVRRAAKGSKRGVRLRHCSAAMQRDASRP